MARKQMRVRGSGLVEAAGVVLTVATVLGFFGGQWWFFDICAHFRVQYFWGLVLATVAMLFWRRHREAACFCFFAVVNFCVIIPLYFGAGPAGDGEMPFRVVLMNVNQATGDSRRVGGFIRSERPDILVLEEVDAGWIGRLAPALRDFPYSKVEPRDDSFGIALFSRFPIAGIESVYIGQLGVPSILARVRIGPHVVTVLATHPMPPSGAEDSWLRDEQLNQVATVIGSASRPALLLGDLNCTPWSTPFRRLERASGLRNSARGFGIQASWPAFNSLLLLPLDHCLHSSDIWVAGRRIGPHVGSDHLPVTIDLAFPTGERR